MMQKMKITLIIIDITGYKNMISLLKSLSSYKIAKNTIFYSDYMV